MLQKKLQQLLYGLNLKVRMTKSLANRLYVKQRLHFYRIVEDKNILDQLE